MSYSKNLGLSFPKDFSSGLILGRFIPLHMGHCFLIDNALRLCKTLHLCLCSTKHDVISGDIRYFWLCERYAHEIACKKIFVHHITKEIYEARSENPEAPKIWADEISKIIPKKIDVVFASEKYGKTFAQYLHADFFSVDQNRDLIPISGRKLIKNPYTHWKYLPTSVRKTMVRIIALQGDNHLLSQDCIKKIKATMYIPYSMRGTQKNTKNHTKHMAISELLTLTTMSKAIICLVCDKNTNNSSCPELQLCEKTYKLTKNTRSSQLAKEILQYIRAQTYWNLRCDY